MTVLLLRHIIIARAGGSPKRTAFKRYHAWIKREPGGFFSPPFLFALANGLSGSIISNYFKDVFQVDSVQRGLLEIPRELPGVVGVFVIAALPSLGNVSLSVLGFALYCVGLLVLGLFSPGYFVMQLFVFTYSLGDHMVMPIRDAIAMDLADEGKTGTFLGRYRGMMTLGSMLASTLVFVGFRVGFFYFRTGVIPSFCAALVFLVVALALLCRLRKTLPALDVRKRSGERRRLPVRRRYLPYYIVTAVYGFQKRMRLVFAPWVIIELLSMGADTVALLGIAAYFCGGWVAPLIGKFLDRHGVQKGLVLESTSVAGVFLFAAWAASGIVNGSLRGWGGTGRRVRLLHPHFPHRPFQFRPRHAHARAERVARGRDGKPFLRPERGPCPRRHRLGPARRGVEVCRTPVCVPARCRRLSGPSRRRAVAEAAAPRRRLSLLDMSKASRRRWDAFVLFSYGSGISLMSKSVLSSTDVRESP